MKFASLLTSARTWLRRTRCKWLLVMTLLCLGLRENYPFSNFPMYSSFSQHTYYLYLTNAAGEPVATRQLGLSSSALKKIFDRARRKELERFEKSGSARVPLAEEAAAQSLLRYLDRLVAAQPPAQKLLAGLQVRHVRVQQQADALRLETRTLARHP
jgi:hypothetical protein